MLIVIGGYFRRSWGYKQSEPEMLGAPPTGWSPINLHRHSH
ncbi:hypothetical protein PROVALCAL_00107 [Providencia alcalifaciens DSM 30120]|uniref:Uncharacterized protein n=1 Tax=Providencia alcalifaciens DSM 30120 TaxID=520999 RepID=B6X9W1_9GAMM|nr:hypothetical protein PROVALCAL_00107 [Providencia alcalifaciens DSM 30120]